MPGPSPAAVTARGVRDGDRAALATLVERRGAGRPGLCDPPAAPGRGPVGARGGVAAVPGGRAAGAGPRPPRPQPAPPAAGPGATAARPPDGGPAPARGGPPTLSWDPAEVAAAGGRPRWPLVVARVVVPAAVAVVAALAALIVAGVFSGGDDKGPAGSVQTEGVLPVTTVRILQRPATTPLPPRGASSGPQRHATAPPRPGHAQPPSAPAKEPTAPPRAVALVAPPPAAPVRESAASLDSGGNGGAVGPQHSTGGGPAADDPGATPASPP